ncbi:hypothetical protein ACFYOK_15915 [Microbispora bryophytorum]|uniref:hypothetical protein n=1 Tax=Microbispora bryophytorum TaxID=1460882 RepID=UPI0033F89731
MNRSNAERYAAGFDKGHLPLLLGTREIILIHHTDSVRGFVYEVETGRLREVKP